MKIRQLLKIQEIAEDRKTPYDIIESEVHYYSETSGTYISIMGMDLIHFIRAFMKISERLHEKEAKLRLLGDKQFDMVVRSNDEDGTVEINGVNYVKE